jgi:hypothetical protein
LRTAGDGEVCRLFEVAATAADKVRALFAGAEASTLQKTVLWLLDKDRAQSRTFAPAPGDCKSATTFASCGAGAAADSVDSLIGSF